MLNSKLKKAWMLHFDRNHINQLARLISIMIDSMFNIRDFYVSIRFKWNL